VAPDGYVLDDTEHELVVNSESGAILDATNEPERVDVPVKKTWVGPAGGPVTVHLLADDVDTGQTLTLTEADDWTGRFTGLRKYTPGANGTEIAYTVEEEPVDGYASKVTGDAESGFTITNTNTETVSIEVAKAWEDASDQDGKRPASVTVELLANGAATGKTLTLSEDNGWTGSFEGMPKYNAAGDDIAYTVAEPDAPSGYTVEVAGDAENGFTVTNSYTPSTTSIKVTKAWDDAGDQDGKRPGSVTVRLLADGADTGKTVELSDENGWSATFDGLPEFEAGERIAYTVEEIPVDGYAVAVSGEAATGFTVTNSYTPAQTSVKVTKAWDDAEDQDGIRPASVTVELLANGAATGKTVELSDENGWTAGFEGIDEFEGGQKIVYTVAEVGVPSGYTAEVTGSAAEGFTVTNAHEPSTTRVSVAKAWADDADADGKRPASVTIRLLANGEDAGRTVELSEANGWVATFDGLPEFEGGRKIAYTVEEVPVEGYASKVTGDAASGFVVTNTRETTPLPPSTSAVPKAGDAASATGAWIAALLGGAAVSLLLWRRTRREL